MKSGFVLQDQIDGVLSKSIRNSQGHDLAAGQDNHEFLSSEAGMAGHDNE
jgi:hypothetical protein